MSSRSLKYVSTEAVQAVLDENSSLIVEIMDLNESAKMEKGAKSAGLAHSIDRKRKQLNQNLIILAKWADESSEAPQPAPVAPVAKQEENTTSAAAPSTEVKEENAEVKNEKTEETETKEDDAESAESEKLASEEQQSKDEPSSTDATSTAAAMDTQDSTEADKEDNKEPTTAPAP